MMQHNGKNKGALVILKHDLLDFFANDSVDEKVAVDRGPHY